MRMKIKELLRRYAAGERNFAGIQPLGREIVNVG